MNSGRRCNSQHPPDYVVPVKHCYDFAKGKCNRPVGECKFAHIQPEPAAVPVPKVDAPLAAAAAQVSDLPSGVPVALPLDASWETAGRPRSSPVSDSAPVPSAAAAAAASSPSALTGAATAPVSSPSRKRRNGGALEQSSAEPSLAEPNQWDALSDEQQVEEVGGSVQPSSLSKLSSPIRAASSASPPTHKKPRAGKHAAPAEAGQPLDKGGSNIAAAASRSSSVTRAKGVASAQLGR